VDDLGERRLVADEEELRVVGMLLEERERGADVERLADLVALLDRELERRAGERGGLGRADERAGRAGGEVEAEPGEGAPRGHGLLLTPGGELALVVGLGAVRHGLAVAEEPELLMGHRPGA
jgi:hypothetical protein